MRLLSSTWLRFSLLFIVGMLLVLGFAVRQHHAGLVPLQEPLPQDPTVQVYFNHSQSSVYTEPYRQQQRFGDDLEQVMIDAIASAQSSIDVASHELRLPHIAQALSDRHQAGVRVRVIIENEYSRPWSSFTSAEAGQLDERGRDRYTEFVQLADQDGDGQLTPAEVEQGDALVIFQKAQIPVIDDTADGSKGSGLMHHKFLVIDNQTVIVTSANLTTSDVHGDFHHPDSRGNANNLVKINSPAIARLYTQEFELMWGDGPGGLYDSKFGVQKPYRPPQTITLAPGSTVTVQFSPTSTQLNWTQSTNGLIGGVLSTARQAVDLALFVFSEQPLSNILQTANQRGVPIRALIDPGFAYRNYSEGLDMMGVALADDRCQHEEDNQPWSQPIASVGIPALADGDILHHKFGVVDRRLVITGSQNWSNTANENNDENVLVIDNATVAAHFQREFERLYNGAILGVPSWLQQKMQRQQCPA